MSNFLCYLIPLQYKPLSETESSQESESGEGPSTQGEESDCHGDSSSQVTSQETGTEDEGTTATEGKLHVRQAQNHEVKLINTFG